MTTLEMTTERADGVAVVTLRGDVDADHADQLHGALGELLAAGVHNFVIDLSGVKVIDGTGLAELVNLFKRVRIGPGDVRLCGFPTWVKVMFAMTRLNRVFDSFETREAAVASFGPAGAGMTRATKAVILAAGQGTRMRSDLPKVLHPVDGKPMVIYCLEATMAAGTDDIIVVVGVGRDEVIDVVEDAYDGVEFAFQDEQLGTGHAVMQARAFLEGFDGSVVVVYGDMPFLSGDTIRSVVDRRDATDAAAVALTIELENPPDFGRIVRDADGRVTGIVEARDATPQQLAVREVNVGTYCFDAAALVRALDRLGSDNAAGEFYLTDVIGILAGDGERVETVVTDRLEEALGVNDPEHLDFAEKVRHIRFAETRYGRVDALARERRPRPSG